MGRSPKGTSKLSRASSRNSVSLQTCPPQEVIQALGAEPGDYLRWEVRGKKAWVTLVKTAQ